MVAVAAAVLLGACGSSSKTSTPPTTIKVKTRPQVTITARDYRFGLPAQIPAGWVDVTLHNVGEQGHQVAFVKLNSLTFAEFQAAADATDLTKLQDAVFVGGPNNVDPGASVTATVHLAAGNYAVVCLIPGADNKPHAAHGMIAPVTVAQTADSDEDTPKADAGKITVTEFTFTPDSSFTGRGTVEIDNIGNQVHEVIIEKMASGTTFAEAKRYILIPPGAPGVATPPGPPPLTSAGGIVGLGPKQTMYQTLTLAPGHYLLACFFPDPTKGNAPHALEGMLKEITVS